MQNRIGKFIVLVSKGVFCVFQNKLHYIKQNVIWSLKFKKMQESE